MQLVDECVSVYDGMKERLYDGKGVLEKFAVHPQQIADYLALVGDTSDNIAGVQKVGAKTAAKWLMQYESLDNIIRCADEIKARSVKTCAPHLPMAHWQWQGTGRRAR